MRMMTIVNITMTVTAMIKRDDEITFGHDYLYNYHSVTFGYGGKESVTIENRDGIIKILVTSSNGETREFTGMYLMEFLRGIGVEMVLPLWE
jgi:hypothetical protein